MSDLEFLGCFGQSDLQRKKNPNCHKYATFEGSFHGQKKFFGFGFFLSCCRVRTEKLHKYLKAEKKWQFLHKKIRSKIGYLWNFKFHCKYIDPLNKSLLASTVQQSLYKAHGVESTNIHKCLSIWPIEYVCFYTD